MEEQRGHLTFDMGGQPTVGDALARIRRESRDKSKKGRWFEQLFMRVALQEPELEIGDIHPGSRAERFCLAES